MKKIVLYALGIAYALILPFVVLYILADTYISYSKVNETLAFLIILAHMDLVGYFMYVMAKNKKK